jgi:hypothetical protein
MTEKRRSTNFRQEEVMRKVLVLILVLFILGSGPALAQEKTAGQAQEQEKHHPAPPETKQPMMGQGMMGQGMMYTCKTMCFLPQIPCQSQKISRFPPGDDVAGQTFFIL